MKIWGILTARFAKEGDTPFELGRHLGRNMGATLYSLRQLKSGGEVATVKSKTQLSADMVLPTIFFDNHDAQYFLRERPTTNDVFWHQKYQI